MYDSKNHLFIIIILLACSSLVKGQPVKPDPHYQFLSSNSSIQDRNFYLFTLFEKMPGIHQLMVGDTLLRQLHQLYRQYAFHADNNKDIITSTAPFMFSGERVRQIDNSLNRLYRLYPQQMGELVKMMRGSGLFQLYAGMNDALLFTHAWQDAAKGINYIITAYTTNKGLLYPGIDSAVLYVGSPAYKVMISRLLTQLCEKDTGTTLFFQPSLHLALGLLTVNKREEAGRYEPLENINGDAYTYLKQVNWDKYPYTAMLILGASPVGNELVSDAGKNRCRMGAEMFRKGMAACIIVSGGHVRPPGTPFSEAVEMKKYLVDELKIPASAVIVEPYARHTTTNFRNAVRIAWRNSIPINKRMLGVSDALHLGYVTSRMFKQRCMQELGYMPIADIQQTDLYFITFTPDLCALQGNAGDPLDP